METEKQAYYTDDQLAGLNIFPVAYGNEEETGLLDNHSGIMGEPYELAGYLTRYLPSDMEFYARDESTAFLQNGGKIYPGGSDTSKSPTNIERATPECIGPAQTARYIRVGEKLLVDVVGNYLVEISANQPGITEARIQRRVIDSIGNRKGCHDNFGLDRKSPIVEDQKVHPSLLAFLASRSFVTGAGLISHDSSSFAQKIDGVRDVRGYGYYGTMYRLSDMEGTPRLEIRCSDINISEWATKMRLGSAALAIAVSQTPLVDRLTGMGEKEALELAPRMNNCKINSDGALAATHELRQAVGIQLELADLVLSRLHLYVETVPPELEHVARELYLYCDDFNKVLGNKDNITLLAKRADWAAKFTLILKRMQRDVSGSLPRSFHDAYSQAGDLHYDIIKLSAQDGVLQAPHYGRGYRLRNKGYFKSDVLNDSQIHAAGYCPPPETRASIRGRLIKTHFVASCDWHYVYLHNENRLHAIDLDDVAQTNLPIEDFRLLKNIKQRRPD